MTPRDVLLVEDSKDVRNVMAEMVSMFGFKVTKAIDGEDAWRKISRASFDLVISDMGLPNMNGEELVRKMRVHNIDTPVILITGVNFLRNKERFGDLSNYSFVQKPFKIEELKIEIHKTLESSKIKMEI